MASDEFRLGLGTLSAATLNGAPMYGTYLLEDFPVQSDQYSALSRPWGPPIDQPLMYPKRARFTTNMDNSRSMDGGWSFTWILAYLTEGMLSYFETTFFGSAASALVTVKTLKSNGVFQVYNATMWLPEPSVDYKPGYHGVEQYTLRFVEGTAIS